MHIIDTDLYRRLVEALATPRPDPFTGDVTDSIKLTLGETADIWPASILDDIATNEQPDQTMLTTAGPIGI